MPSSTSSSEHPARSDARRWRGFFLRAAGIGFGAVAVLFVGLALIDPFDELPLSPALDRAPVSTNARFSYPALARSPRFDSVVIGNSTSRLLRPDRLDQAFGGARFANLGMNAATAWEEQRMLGVFARSHALPRVIIVGLDVSWCPTGDAFEHYTPRPFPEWMYDDNRWAGYAHLLNLDAIQQAGRQAGVIAGLKSVVYGRDGYARFVPPESEYDLARVRAHLDLGAAVVPLGPKDGPPASWRFPALDLLRDRLAELPPGTLKVLFFAPYYVGIQPEGDRPGDPAGRVAWAECKARAARIVDGMPGAVLADFMRPTPITSHDDNYWDPLHYRVGIADRIVADLAAAAALRTNADYVMLAPAMAFAE